MTDCSPVSGWILLIFLLSNTVYCQERISVYTGSDVLLPCSYSLRPSSELNVFWRYKDPRHNLYDIISGRPDLSEQDQRFRGRVRSFSELYAQGNYSVVLMNVNLDDAGPYTCNIPTAGPIYKQQLELTVKAPGGGSVSVREHTPCGLLFIMMSLILLLSV